MSTKGQWVQISCSNAEPQQTASVCQASWCLRKSIPSPSCTIVSSMVLLSAPLSHGVDSQTQFNHPEIVSFYNVYKGDLKIDLVKIWHPLRLKTPLRFCSPFQKPHKQVFEFSSMKSCSPNFSIRAVFASNYNSCVIPTKLRQISRQFATLTVKSTKWKERVILWVIFPGSEATIPQY